MAPIGGGGATASEPQAESFWGSRRGTTLSLVVMLGIGVMLLSIGLSNEARIRPYQYYYNCEEYTDIDDFTWMDCESEPPEYEIYIAIAIIGAIVAFVGGGLLANLAYHSRHPDEPSSTSLENASSFP